MDRLLAAVDELLTCATTSGSLERVQQTARLVQHSLGTATIDQQHEALRRLAARLPQMHPVPAAQVAIACGALVEHGGDPQIAGPAILDLVVPALAGAAAFHELCREKSSLIAPADEAPHADQLAEEHFEEILHEHPPLAWAYMGEREVSLAAIAHLARSKPLRAAARTRPELLTNSQSLDRHYARGHSFLTKMLLVLDDEPLLVLHPERKLGYRATISAIPDNFTLHTVLMANLLGDPREGWIDAEGEDLRLLRRATIAQGGESAPVVAGLFNLVNWTGVDASRKLASGTQASDHWIWNEGVPADIRPFDGLRIVVLGDPPYQRSWRAGLMFSGMLPEFTVQEKLPASEVSAWLAKLAAVPHGE